MPWDHNTERACPLREMLLTVVASPGGVREEFPSNANSPSCGQANSSRSCGLSALQLRSQTVQARLRLGRRWVMASLNFWTGILCLPPSPSSSTYALLIQLLLSSSDLDTKYRQSAVSS